MSRVSLLLQLSDLPNISHRQQNLVLENALLLQFAYFIPCLTAITNLNRRNTHAQIFIEIVRVKPCLLCANRNPIDDIPV